MKLLVICRRIEGEQRLIGLHYRKVNRFVLFNSYYDGRIYVYNDIEYYPTLHKNTSTEYDSFS